MRAGPLPLTAIGVKASLQDTELARQRLDRRQVHRGVVADRGVRATAGFRADDALGLPLAV